MFLLPYIFITVLWAPKVAESKQSTPLWTLVFIILGMKSSWNKYKLWQLKIFTTIKTLNSDEHVKEIKTKNQKPFDTLLLVGTLTHKLYGYF